MAEYLFRLAAPGDAEQLAANLRRADLEEIVAASGGDPLEIIQDSVAMTPRCRAFLVDGELACLFGMAPIGLLGETGAPWLLGTPVIERHPSALIRFAFPYLAEMLADRPHLVNYVDARNAKSIRWLKRLGFTFHPAAPYGAAGLPFHRFELRLEDV